MRPLDVLAAAVCVGVLVGAITLSTANYFECRSVGFSVRYCVLTTLIR